MKVIPVLGNTERDKLYSIVKAFPDAFDGRILDMGCRSQMLQTVIKSDTDYCGLDLYPPATIIGNIGDGLPFRAESFNSVIALDVLEHVDKIHQAFIESCRVSHRYVVICLPNIYEVRVRFAFLMGKSISGKYGLPLKPPADRHRWLFSFSEARRFIKYWASELGVVVITEAALIGPRLNNGVGPWLTWLNPDLWARWYLAVIAKPHGNQL